jgi:signal transduction histidine kinase
MRARFSAANRWWVAAMTGVVLSVSIFPGQYSPPSWVWLTSLTLAGLYRFAGRWPLAVLVIQSASAVPLMVTDLWGMSGLIPLVPALTLIELIARAKPIRDGMLRSWTGQVVGSVAWTVALLLGRLLEGPMRASLFVGVALSVAIPVLVGLYLHAQRALAQAAQARATDAERAEERSAELARSEERAALARELHDLVSHRMASIALSSSVALRY